MEAKNKTLLENVFSMSAVQFIAYIFPLITTPYITRTIGAEKYGLIAFAASFIQYLIILVDYGVENSGIYRIANNRHNKKSMSNIFNSIMASKILLFFFCTILMLILTFSIPKLREISPLILVSYLSVVGNVLFTAWFFIGIEKMKYLAVFNIISGTIFALMIFLFIKNPENYILIPFFTSLGLIVSGIYSIYIAVKKEGIKLYIPKWSSIRYQYKFSTNFFLTKIAGFVNNITNTFCLGFIGSMTLVGYYTAAYNAYFAFSCLIAAIIFPIYPYMIKNKDLTFYKKYSMTAIIGCSALFSFLFIFAKPLITLYYGENLEQAYPVFQIFCIKLVVEIISCLLAEPILGGFGHIKESNYASIITSVIQFAGLIILLYTGKFNIYSIVYLMIASTILCIFVRLYYIIKFGILKNNEITHPEKKM